MDPTISFVISEAAKALIGWMVGQVANAASKRLADRNKLERAIQAAIAEGLAGYLEDTHRNNVSRALKKQSFWSELTPQIQKLIDRAEDEPESSRIARAWAEILGDPLLAEGLEPEVEKLLRHIRAALRASETLRPMLDSGRLEDIAIDAAESADQLRNIVSRLDAILSLDDGPFRVILTTLQQGAPSLQELIWKGQENWIAKGISGDMVMRTWLFHSVRDFLSTASHGYLLIRGEPGVGKSTMAAQLTTELQAALHVNSRFGGPRDAHALRRNIGAQLALRYHESVMIHAFDLEDSGLLLDLMSKAGKKSSDPVIIVVDALDEATSPRAGESPLGLPAELPNNVYLIATARPHVNPWWIGSGIPLDIMPLGTDNQSDARNLVWRRIQRGLGRELARRSKLDSLDFVKLIVERSEGNFMYLRHVLDDLELGRGIPERATDLPQGLKNYYTIHLDQLGLGKLPERRLRALFVLAKLEQPVTASMLAFVTDQGILEVQQDLELWREFLEEDQQHGEKVYHLYHSAFADFLLDTPPIHIVQDAMSDLAERVDAWSNKVLYGDNP